MEYITEELNIDYKSIFSEKERIDWFYSIIDRVKNNTECLEIVIYLDNLNLLEVLNILELQLSCTKVSSSNSWWFCIDLFVYNEEKKLYINIDWDEVKK